MFDLPEAKRVRRDEILSRESTSPSPSPPPETAYQNGHQRLAELLNFDVDVFAPEQTTAANNEPDHAKSEQQQGGGEGEGEGGEDEEQEFEFRLFSAPKPSTATPTAQKDERKGEAGATQTQTQKLRIRVRSPTPGPADLSEGRFVNPFRGWQYYFTNPGLLSGSKENGDGDEDDEVELKRRQFEDVAVTGEHMLDWASVQPWPGCHLPWRIIHLKRQHTKLPKDPAAPTPATTVYTTDPPTTRTPKSHKKPGKKRRIQLRKRVTAAETAKLADSEKRNRKNRERKIKRRQKAREQKAAAAIANGEDPDVVMAEGDGDGSSGEE
ncbi:DUF2011 domain-containing protein [Aspergillus glaucus CBS 516.65]|uniref:Uncharacterized protein n=1 Tax=Aspergillus glaucus CBS 516.65 TaxID=1160497 RepID=A0A1L9VQG7_ASPGL|nr:hypothetical protein ASPGLDRAFT_45219 [Aspergillus glaucus CBS 516.65]OJJ86178.1 hypothetical protein ASPGLDRAFT_45219 [Aspergillus glaucus CBS 516.65]